MVLFFLLMLSLMTLSLLNSSYLELRMSQNMAFTAQRFQAAEAGLRLTEHQLNNLSKFISEIHKHFDYAGFRINVALKKHKIHYCINQRLAYIYDVLVQAQQTIGEGLTLKTTYVIKTSAACSGELILSKAGRSSWRELRHST
jgi:hypothetical protein